MSKKRFATIKLEMEKRAKRGYFSIVIELYKDEANDLIAREGFEAVNNGPIVQDKSVKKQMNPRFYYYVSWKNASKKSFTFAHELYTLTCQANKIA